MSVDVMDAYGVKENKSSLRKSNKPIMEKRRRERINNCLTQLKTLVLESMKKDSSQYSKLEKADILEMTVKYLRNVQRQQLANAIASDPNVVSKYRAGYHECATEVTRYLDATQNVGPDVKSRLAGHLSDCLQAQPTCKSTFGQQKISPVREQIDTATPLSVQIPHNNSNFSSVSNSNGLLITSSQSPQQNAINLCQNGHPVLTSSPVRNMQQTANISGQFQILPSGNVYNGPIAIYMGNVNQPDSPPQSTIPVFTLHVPETTSSPSHVLSKSNEYPNNVQGSQISGNFNSCQRLSEEKLWRPW